MTDYVDRVLIYTTWPNVESAEEAGRALVTERLAACVNILGQTILIYEWEGKAQRDTEVPMLIKTVRANVDEVTATMRRLHPYDVPAVAVMGIEGGNSEFLAWIGEQTGAGATSGSDVDNDE